MRVNFFLGTYEIEQTRAFLAAVGPKDVVYDIGAHVGHYTLLASVLATKGHVFSFEPSLRNLVRLHQHLAVNGCRNVTVLGMAVSKDVGVERFEDRTGSGVGHLPSAGSLAVYVTALDVLVGKLPMPQVI